MGCLSEEEKEKILKRFWETQESIRREIRRGQRRVREAAANAQDPYHERLLGWTVDNWDLVARMAREGAEGLFGANLVAVEAEDSGRSCPHRFSNRSARRTILSGCYSSSV